MVRSEQLDMNIAVLDINSLNLHEETIPSFVKHLTHLILRDGCIKDPIMVDKESLVVLDGVHRVAALKKLCIRRIPACLVDYHSPNVKVFRWLRTLTAASKLQSVVEQIMNLGIDVRPTEQFDERSIGISPVVSVVMLKDRTFVLRSSFKNLKEAYDIIERVEKQLRKSGLRVRYETEQDAVRSLQAGQVDAVLFTPKLTKQQIIAEAVQGHVFAYKASRHVIPARPMRLNVPLALLKDENRSLTEVNAEVRKMLQKRQVRRLPSGSVLDGRRYEEELYVFEG